MTVYPEEEVRAAAERLIEHHSKASEVTDWTFFVDETYTEDAVYLCEYAGVRPVTAVGRKQIKETHYGEDMGGFEDWTFPYDGYAVNGNRIITHWWNAGRVNDLMAVFIKRPACLSLPMLATECSRTSMTFLTSRIR